MRGKVRKSQTRGQKAGLLLSVSKVANKIKSFGMTKRVSSYAPVAVTAAAEYIANELIELSRNVSSRHKMVRTTPMHLRKAIAEDSELNELFASTHICGGGVTPRPVTPKKKKVKTVPLPKKTAKKMTKKVAKKMKKHEDKTMP